MRNQTLGIFLLSMLALLYACSPDDDGGSTRCEDASCDDANDANGTTDADTTPDTRTTCTSSTECAADEICVQSACEPDPNYDRSPPQLDSSTPAANATGVSIELGSVQLVFDEAIDVSTATATTVQLSEVGGDRVSVEVGFEPLQPRVLTLTVLSDLMEFETPYRVTIDGVADLNGNAVTDLEVEFTTTLFHDAFRYDISLGAANYLDEGDNGLLMSPPESATFWRFEAVEDSYYIINHEWPYQRLRAIDLLPGSSTHYVIDAVPHDFPSTPEWWVLRQEPDGSWTIRLHNGDNWLDWDGTNFVARPIGGGHGGVPKWRIERHVL